MKAGIRDPESHLPEGGLRGVAPHLPLNGQLVRPLLAMGPSDPGLQGKPPERNIQDSAM